MNSRDKRCKLLYICDCQNMQTLTYSKSTKPSHVAITANVFCLYFIKNLLPRDRNLSVKESVVCRETFTYLRKHSAGEFFFSWTGECFKWKDNRSFCFVLLSNSVIFTCLKFKLSRRDIYPNLKLIQNAKRVRKVF